MVSEPRDILSSDSLWLEQTRSLAEIYGELGRALFNQKRYGDAAQAFREAIRERPDSAELQVYLAQVREAQNKMNDALRAYLEAVRLSPPYAGAVLPKAHSLLSLLTPAAAQEMGEWLDGIWRPALEKQELPASACSAVYGFLARTNLYRGNFRQARMDYERALSTNPDDIYSREGLGEALWREGDLDGAACELEKATQLADQVSLQDRRATTRFRLTRVLMGLQRYEQAIQVAKTGLGLDKVYDIKLQVLISQCYQALKQSDQALSSASDALKQDPNQVEAYVVRAAASYDQKQYEAAAQAAETALKLAPTHLEAIRIRALALLDGELDKDDTQALPLLQVYLRQRPEDVDLQRRMIRGLKESGRPTGEIVELLKLAIVKAPPERRPVLLLDLTESYLESNESTNALQTLKEVADLDPDIQNTVKADEDPSSTLQKARWWRLYGDAQRQSNLPDEALSSYERGLGLAPDDHMLLEHYAELLQLLNDWPRAVEGWQRLIQVTPDDPKIYLNLAHAQQHAGDASAALASLETARTLNSEYPFRAQAYELTAELLKRLERPAPECALAYFEAGRNHYWNDKFDDAVRMFSNAQQLNDRHLPTYWYLAETYLIQSYTSEPPLVKKDELDRALEAWEAGLQLALGRIEDTTYSWAYTTRSRIYNQQALLEPGRKLVLSWQAITCLERGALLRAGDAIALTDLAGLHHRMENEAVALYLAGHAVELSPEETYALDERASILADTGDFERALEVIDQRLKIKPDAWLTTVKGFVLLFQGEYAKALEFFNEGVEAGSDVWNRSLRAVCYDMLDNPASAYDDFKWVWEQRSNPKFNIPDNASSFGRAAYNLALLKPGSESDYLEEAIAIFKRLYDSPDPMIRVSSDLGKCYLTRGSLEHDDFNHSQELFKQAATDAIDPREVVDMRRFDIANLEKHLDKWPHRVEAQKRVQEFKDALDKRYVQLASGQAHTPEEERSNAEQQLLEILANPDQKGPTESWARVGAQAALARLYGEQERWHEAGKLYQSLREKAERFPEAVTGLERAIEELAGAGENQLQDSKYEQAVESLQQALAFEGTLSRPAQRMMLQQKLGDAFLQAQRASEAMGQFTQVLALASGANDRRQQADLYGRMSLASFDLENLATARESMLHALQLYRDTETLDPAVALSGVWRSLLRDASHYWRLDSQMESLKNDSALSESQRIDIASLQVELIRYLDELYKLADVKDQTSTIPVVRPVVFELGDGIVPMVDSKQDGGKFLYEELPALRERIFKNRGVRVPGVNARGNNSLKPNEYLFMLDEALVAQGEVQLGMDYAAASVDRVQALGIPAQDVIEITNPLTGEPACWAARIHRDTLEREGIQGDIETRYILLHLQAVLEQNLADFVGVQEVDSLLSAWGKTSELAEVDKLTPPPVPDGPKLIAAALPDATTRRHFARLLRVLVRERVPITAGQVLLETVQERGLTLENFAETERAVRICLRDKLPGNGPNAHRRELWPDWEDKIASWVRDDQGMVTFQPPPEETQQFLGAVREWVDSSGWDLVLNTRQPNLRPYVRRLLEFDFPNVMVLAQEELLSPVEPPQTVIEAGNMEKGEQINA